jgi:site-specific DNA recombinase
MESAWSNGKPAYRCRHGHTTASVPSLDRPKNAYVREDLIVSHLPMLHLLHTEAGAQRRRRTRRGIDVRCQATADASVSYLCENQITLIYDPASGTLRAGTGEAATTITLKTS